MFYRTQQEIGIAKELVVMDEKKKTAGRAVSDEAKMVKQLIRNYEEDCGFADVLDRFARHEFAAMGTIPVCKTPLVLSLGGADLRLDVIINPKTILKCMSKPDERFHGHDLDKDLFKYLIFEMRNPAMLLKGSKLNTLVAVTDLMDRQGRPIIVSIALGRRNTHHLANQITSAYGRNDFPSYLKRQVELGNLIAINKNKANQMFQSAGVQFPMEETLISFDNSIAYSFENVKVLSVENYKKISGADDLSKVGRKPLCVDAVLNRAQQRTGGSSIRNPNKDHRDMSKDLDA